MFYLHIWWVMFLLCMYLSLSAFGSVSALTFEAVDIEASFWDTFGEPIDMGFHCVTLTL